MNKDYTHIISQLSLRLFSALWETEIAGRQLVVEVEQQLVEILRLVGLQVVEMILRQLSKKVTRSAEQQGLTVHRRIWVKYAVIFGCIEVESPYLWDRKNHRSARPVKEQLGIKHGGRSLALQRVLTDFGIEESFGQAAKRFQEHYGWEIERGTVRREVEEIGSAAEKYVDMKLLEAFLSYEQPDAKPATDDRVIVELDGCQIRTAKKVESASANVTPKRHLPVSSRPHEWREVRVGFARQLQEPESRTFVARMSKYPEIVQRLVSAACDRGMKRNSQVIAIADGGNGLRESLTAFFPKLQFILDRAHAKQHLYDTAEAMGLRETDRHCWVTEQIHNLDSGQVQKVLEMLFSYQGIGADKVQNLYQYLGRFADAVHYDYFRAQGLPIGSGEIESAHRYIPQKRLKIPGASWHPDTINPLLALRVIRANNWWQDFWQYLKHCSLSPSMTMAG